MAKIDLGAGYPIHTFLRECDHKAWQRLCSTYGPDAYVQFSDTEELPRAIFYVAEGVEDSRFTETTMERLMAAVMHRLVFGA